MKKFLAVPLLAVVPAAIITTVPHPEHRRWRRRKILNSPREVATRKIIALAVLGFALVAGTIGTATATTVYRQAALAPAVVAQSPAFACNAAPEFTRLNYPLRHTARRLGNGEPLVIVAIGSSSTSGSGASSPAATYPSRLAVELKHHFPAHDITVLNR